MNFTPLSRYIIINPILQIRKVKYKELNYFPKVEKLESVSFRI